MSNGNDIFAVYPGNPGIISFFLSLKIKAVRTAVSASVGKYWWVVNEMAVKRLRPWTSPLFNLHSHQM
jgi:hypothetical protein